MGHWSILSDFACNGDGTAIVQQVMQGHWRAGGSRVGWRAHIVVEATTVSDVSGKSGETVVDVVGDIGVLAVVVWGTFVGAYGSNGRACWVSEVTEWVSRMTSGVEGEGVRGRMVADRSRDFEGTLIFT